MSGAQVQQSLAGKASGVTGAQTRPGGMSSAQIQQSLSGKAPGAAAGQAANYQRPATGTTRPASTQASNYQRSTTKPSTTSRPSSGGNAFNNISNPRETYQQSSRGQASRSTMPQSRPSTSQASRASSQPRQASRPAYKTGW